MHHRWTCRNCYNWSTSGFYSKWIHIWNSTETDKICTGNRQTNWSNHGIRFRIWANSINKSSRVFSLPSLSCQSVKYHTFKIPHYNPGVDNRSWMNGGIWPLGVIFLYFLFKERLEKTSPSVLLSLLFHREGPRENKYLKKLWSFLHILLIVYKSHV
jgi:hypothetical protein